MWWTLLYKRERTKYGNLSNHEPTLNRVHHDYPAGKQMKEIESDKYVFVVVAIWKLNSTARSGEWSVRVNIL